MRTLLDTYFYSVLYYNAVIWLTPEMSSIMKQNLLSISANALRSCIPRTSCDISFEKIHEIHGKCTPIQISTYLNATNLHKILNPIDIRFENVTLLNQMICTGRQTMFQIWRENKSKIGLNTTANKFYSLSGKIALNSLNFSFVHFKKLMKIQFLKYGKT